MNVDIPSLDAVRYYEDLDKHNAEVQANRAMYEEMFLEACGKGNADCLSHGDAVTTRKYEGGQLTGYTTKLQPLHITISDLGQTEAVGKLVAAALLACAMEGHPDAVAAIKALAQEYGEQKGDA